MDPFTNINFIQSRVYYSQVYFSLIWHLFCCVPLLPFAAYYFACTDSATVYISNLHLLDILTAFAYSSLWFYYLLSIGDRHISGNVKDHGYIDNFAVIENILAISYPHSMMQSWNCQIL